jgi:hypothetical protein
MQDIRIRQKLLSERGLTLEKCLEIARSYEATKIRMKAMQDKTDTIEAEVNIIESTNINSNTSKIMKVNLDSYTNSVISVVETSTNVNGAQPKTQYVTTVVGKVILEQSVNLLRLCMKFKIMKHKIMKH